MLIKKLLKQLWNLICFHCLLNLHIHYADRSMRYLFHFHLDSRWSLTFWTKAAHEFYSNLFLSGILRGDHFASLMLLSKLALKNCPDRKLFLIWKFSLLPKSPHFQWCLELLIITFELTLCSAVFSIPIIQIRWCQLHTIELIYTNGGWRRYRIQILILSKFLFLALL